MVDPNIKDVARASQASIGTVSNVLNHPERVAQATQDRVFEAIRTLGYVRNDVARQLRAGKSTTLGLALPATSNPFFAAVAHGAEEVAAERDLRVVLGSTGDTGGQESRYLDLFEQLRVRGVMLSPVSYEPSRLDGLRRRNIPVVLIDHVDPAMEFPAVTVDNRAGGYLAVNHLIERGARRIVFIGATGWTQQIVQRFAGAQEAAGHHPDVVLARIDLGEMTVSAGRALGHEMLANWETDSVDGIFAGNDLIALGILQAFVMSKTLRVPHDVRLVGFDDIDFAQSAIVSLSSIRQPAEEIGRAAVATLLTKFEHPETPAKVVKFEPELIVRDSS